MIRACSISGTVIYSAVTSPSPPARPVMSLRLNCRCVTRSPPGLNRWPAGFGFTLKQAGPGPLTAAAARPRPGPGSLPGSEAHRRTR
eukprot:732640-Hanusia_phi.AAC.1